eukprot:s1190_g13.t1
MLKLCSNWCCQLVLARLPDDCRDRALRHSFPRPEFSQIKFNVLGFNPDPLVRLILEVRLDAHGLFSIAFTISLEYPGHLIFYGYHVAIAIQL